MRAAVKTFPTVTTMQPSVGFQVGRFVELINAGHIPVGTYLSVGEAVAVVRRHNRSKTTAELVYERSAERWRVPTKAVPLTAEVAPLDRKGWGDLLKGIYDKRIRIGNIRQEHLDNVPAFAPPLNTMRMLVVGTSGCGKSTAMVSVVSRWLNSMTRKLLESSEPRIVPGVLCFDLHGDFAGYTFDEDGEIRPSLTRCLLERPVVLRRGDITCGIRDIPVPIIVQCLGRLSAAQSGWCNLYASQEDDHDSIEVLLGNESDWPNQFPEMATDGEIESGARKTLVALRKSFSALLREPLFVPNGQPSTWNKALDDLYQGKCVIVDLHDFPPRQQSLLAVVLMRMLMHRQFKSLAQGLPPFPLVVVADEFHKLTEARATAQTFFRETRKLSIGTILGSQRPSDFESSVLANCTHGIVLRSNAVDIRKLIDLWPGLSPYGSHLLSLEAGDGFLVGRHVAWPVRFSEPEKIRA